MYMIEDMEDNCKLMWFNEIAFVSLYDLWSVMKLMKLFI